MWKRLRSLIWLGLAIGALGYLVSQTDRESFGRALKDVDWRFMAGAVMLYFSSQTLLATRWVLLLRVHGVRISLFQAVKLTYLGLFYNNMMPGAVGGDLLKGWYITHHSKKEQRVEAAVTVFVDRLVGLMGMLMVGTLASLFVGSELVVRLGGREIQVRHMVWMVLGAMVVVAVTFLSRRVRRALLLSWLLEKLPFTKQLRQIDAAIRIYKQHIRTMVLALMQTVVIQSLSILSVLMLAKGLHMEGVGWGDCLLVLPIVWLITAAIPVPGGLGVMENLFVPFFMGAMGAAAGDEFAQGQVAALALLNRVMLCFCSLPGALVPMFGGHLPKRKEMEE